MNLTELYTILPVNLRRKLGYIPLAGSLVVTMLASLLTGCSPENPDSVTIPRGGSGVIPKNTAAHVLTHAGAFDWFNTEGKLTSYECDFANGTAYCDGGQVVGNYEVGSNGSFTVTTYLTDPLNPGMP